MLMRPILMTSLAFIPGVVPLMLGAGAGAKLCSTICTAVFFGMIGVTLFGLGFTPMFYAVIRRLTGAETKPQRDSAVTHGAQPVAAE